MSKLAGTHLTAMFMQNYEKKKCSKSTVRNPSPDDRGAMYTITHTSTHFYRVNEHVLHERMKDSCRCT
jgi:hypothetical protein